MKRDIQSSSAVSLVVGEPGSAWDQWADRLRLGDEEVCVVVKRPQESRASFMARLRRSVGGLESSGHHIGHAVLVAGDESASCDLASRSSVLRVLCAAMLRGAGGEVLLSGGSDADRWSLKALAEVVTDLMRGTGVTVAPVAVEAQAA